MSHQYMLAGIDTLRFNTRSLSVAFGSLRPFGPVSGSNVARGPSVAFGYID